MGGIAALAQAAGHKVTGCDANVYPPMSTQLQALGIALIEGYSAEQIDLAADIYVIGNAITRGNPLIEEILNRGLPYLSGPQWLAENILRDKHVLAVAGTHGKTTTSSMLTWILQQAGVDPGFLIGGVPLDFAVTARLSSSRYFVIEADEYDTAFFDKRSKFVHYRPRTLILNNLEFDHADIFADLNAIETQFHHLLRTVPSNGRLVVNGAEHSLRRVIARGCWSELQWFGENEQWQVREDTIEHCGQMRGHLAMTLPGRHNQLNALAAIAAANHIGVPIEQSLSALGSFKGIKRRLEIRGVVNGITIYDDFAHHPTAIAATIQALRDKVGQERIIAVLEPRTNTMKLGAMRSELPGSLQKADLVFCYAKQLGWDAHAALVILGSRATVHDDIYQLVTAIKQISRAGDHVLIMSNGGFDGVHEKLLLALHNDG